jgi:hypothetical protein
MKRRRITSSVIAELGYEQETNTMELKFTTGRVYQYFMVPAAAFDALLKSKSVGRYFNREIRDQYPNREIIEE